jgi:CHAT domain-containing protein
VHPRYAEFAEPAAPTIAEVRAAIGPRAVALEYLLGETRSDVWALTSDGLFHAELPPRARLEAAARELLHAVAAPSGAPTRNVSAVSDAAAQRAADALSRLILEPVARALDRPKVYVVADGLLQLVPFAALPAADAIAAAARRRPLMATHEIVSLPSLSMLTMTTRDRVPLRAKRLAVFADPVYEASDPRLFKRPAAPADTTAFPAADLSAALRQVRGTTGPLLRLTASADESAAIVRLAAGRQVSRFEGPAATREAALDLAGFDIVHFATHGIISDRRPELSGLVMSLFDENGRSTDGFLRLIDVYGLSLSAELVVLSACESGVGKAVSGEGVIGLTRGFLLAGAARVLSTLWQVNDVATAELMSAFYTALLRDQLPPSAALRQAQMQMWRSGRFRSLRYWAPFTIYGD